MPLPVTSAHMMRRSTPSLTSLRAFEAYARLGRLVDAADELCVTHGAVSRQIKKLEEQLGIKLLTGHPGKVVMTKQAIRYAQQLTGLFDGLDMASASLRKASEARLQILCPGSFSMRWLIPHISDFTDQHPQIDLEMVDSSGPWSLANDGPHGAIRLQGYEGATGARSRIFMERKFGPVLSPAAYADGISKPSHVLGLPRLRVNSIPTDWNDWASAAEVQLPNNAHEISFDRSFHMLEAALNGLGVCIADLAYVSAEIEAGRLVAPFGFAASARSYVFMRGQQCQNRTVDTFENWLVETGTLCG